MARDFGRLLAWLLALSVIFWSAVALYSCDAGAPRPTDLAPAESKQAPAEKGRLE
jgi:hypothetical protein